MNNKQKEYCRTICNFYNNLCGYMENKEISNLIFCIFNEKINDTKIGNFIEEIRLLNSDIECDNDINFCIDLCDLYNKIKEGK